MHPPDEVVALRAPSSLRTFADRNLPPLSVPPSALGPHCHLHTVPRGHLIDPRECQQAYFELARPSWVAASIVLAVALIVGFPPSLIEIGVYLTTVTLCVHTRSNLQIMT